jgi:gas vesicle protein
MTEQERRMTDAGYDPEMAGRVAGADEPGSRTAEIEREIEHTRAKMSREIDEISERLRPATLARETVETVRDEARRTTANLADMMRENSLAVAAVGLGATWWFVQRERGGPVSGDRMHRYAYTAPDRWSGEYDRRGGGFRRRVSDKVSDARQAVSGVASGVAERAGSVKERAGEVVGRVQERVQDVGTAARERASDLGAKAREQGRRAQTGVERTLEENPLILVAGAAVLGLAVGLLLPSTQREDEVLGPSRDRLAERAGETFDRAKEVAAEAAREVKETVRTEVRERAPELKSVVQDAAERVGEQVKQTATRAAQETKEAVRDPGAGSSSVGPASGRGSEEIL